MQEQKQHSKKLGQLYPQKEVSLPNVNIFRIYSRALLIFLTKALSNFCYTSLFTFFCRHKSFHSSFTFFPKILIQCIHNSFPLKSLIEFCRQSYAFFSKPPRKKKEFCKLSAKSPKICKIPNRAGQNLRHLRNQRAIHPNDRIGRKILWESFRIPRNSQKSCYFILILLLIFINFISRYTIYMEYIMYLCTKIEPFKQIQL